jgi:Cu/Ag efflux protein CusF
MVLGIAAALGSPVFAQMSGGGQMGGGQAGGGGRGGRGGKGGGRSPDSGQAAKKPGSAPADPADKPTNQIEITGVVKSIDPATSRVTIAYDAVEELNWPHGTMPFPVAKDALLNDLKVGMRVRFKVESHEIYEIAPLDLAKKAEPVTPPKSP